MIGKLLKVFGLLAIFVMAAGTASAQQVPMFQSTNCANSPQMGRAILCYDSTLNGFFSWNPTVDVFQAIGIANVYGAGFDFVGTPSASEQIGFTTPYTINVPANYASPTSVCTCGTSPSGNQTYTITANGTSEGSFTVTTSCGATASASNVTLPTNAAFQVTAGQALVMTAPSSSVSGADIKCTIAFTR
jgi:hypothetical protein